MAHKRGTLRIIGGQWRGRRLPIVETEGLRPTPDRVRETLFNWLQQEIVGSHCLDLFAGTGALAFEALSRGAEQVTAVERNPRACKQMQLTATDLGTDRLTVVCADVGDFLRQTTNTDSAAGPNSSPDFWQIVFVDPPYSLGYPPPQWPQLNRHPRLAADALVYLESHADYRDTVLNNTAANWVEKRKKVAGEVCYRLLQRDDFDNNQ
ncbi:MAG: 16S rRNA (guanine(966)-N(2))-methyltransferase RsmD [Gammaproteobacteria bacterium]|nr:MAG: 16S rRNA (guanine(966)-N(2))-methyltransferase RsmD [Gammaproteobacteria bacterium]